MCLSIVSKYVMNGSVSKESAVTDPRPREQMTPPEELASIYEKYSRRYDDEVVVALRRLAALEREKEVLENAWAGLSAENARLREALHVIRITGPEREAGLAREALAGAPDEESDA
jgi:hypothetical protein